MSNDTMPAAAGAEPVLSEARVEEMATELSTMAIRPEFLERLNVVRTVPLDQKLGAAVHAIDEIRHEVSFPQGFRLTPRQFEMPSDGRSVIDIDDGVATIVHDGTVIVVTENARAAAGAYDHPQPPLDVARAIREGVIKIGRFVCTPEFKALLTELYAQRPQRRADFVRDVVLNRTERERRGIDDNAAGLIIQRSEFADGRPTLFCITKMLGLAHPWQKVTITFDNDQATVRTSDALHGQDETT